MDSRLKSKFDNGSYGIFWDEYRHIQQSHPRQPDIEDGCFKKEGITFGLYQ